MLGIDGVTGSPAQSTCGVEVEADAEDSPCASRSNKGEAGGWDSR